MFTRKHKRLLKRLVRNGLAYRYDELMERALTKARLDACTENGRIAICRTGHDCDHMHYDVASIQEAPRSFFAWLKAEEKHCEYLDGPERMWIDKPSNVEEHHTCRDVAAEMAGY